MEHVEQGHLMAWIDGELAGGELAVVEAHLSACGGCAGEADRLASERALTRAGLAGLALEHPPLTRSRARILARARLPAPPRRSIGRPRRGGRAPLRWPYRRAARGGLLKAAAMVLLLAGGASALVPGSPVRRWLAGPIAAPPAAVPSAFEAATAATGADEMGVRVGPSGGRIRVALDLPAGSLLTVRLVDGESAAVFAQAAHFRSADGLLEATAEAGPVRVELPRGVGEVSLDVAGRPYLRVRDGRPELAATAEERTDSSFSFRVPAAQRD